MQPTIVLECLELAKSFRQGREHLDVLRNVNLQVKRGERLSVIGSSGSGKSTLLHLLGGLDTPTSGSVWVGDQKLNSMNDTDRGKLRNRNLGFIYQFHHLLPEFTVLENVSMPILIRGNAPDHARELAITMLDKVGLCQRLQHKPGELSGGERQRAAVARALITGPACVLADEPTGNLDRYSAKYVLELILELNRDLETSFVIVTHDSELASSTEAMWRLVDGVLVRES
jgi:lipoprotein-releasing system ATP-binding protein